jgi:hypothetical protein
VAKIDALGGACSTVSMKDAQRVLVGESEEMRPHGRTSRRWKDNIKIDLKVILCETLD